MLTRPSMLTRSTTNSGSGHLPLVSVDTSFASGEGTSSHRWIVLAVFGYNAAFNAVASMNFSAVSSLSEELLSTDSTGVDWLYSGMLFSVLPAVFPAAYGLVRVNYATSLAGIGFNVLGGWLRFWAASSGSFVIALLSSVSLGLAAGVIICSYTSLAERHFPPHERALATSIGVQCNYFGWALGSMIPVAAVDTPSMRATLLVQAILMTGALPVFLLLTRTPTPADGTDAAHAEPSPRGSERHSLLQLGRNGRFWMHALCYALLGGVSFTIPGIQDDIFTKCLVTPKFSSDQTMWTNFAFIISGVITGLTAGYWVSEERQAAVLQVLFSVAAAALLAISVLSTPDVAKSIHDAAPHLLYDILVVLMALAGAGCLGFLGLGLRRASAIGHPAPEAFTGGSVEWLVQLFGGLLTQISSCALSFYACTGVACVVAVTLAVLNRISRAPATDHEQGLLS